MKKTLIILFLLLSCSVFSQEKQFLKACTKNTIEAYDQFLSKYPASQYTEDTWYKKAILINTVEGWQDIMRQFPNGKYDSIAATHLCQLEFNAAKSINTVEGYESYLKKYPKCENSQMAQGLLMSLEFKEAESKNTIEAYNSFLSNYPTGSYLSKAKVAIEKIDFEKAKGEKSVSAFTDFMSKYPDGLFIKDARKEIEEIYFQNAKKANSVAALNKFIIDYPNGYFTEDAKKSIEEIDFNAAAKINTVAAMNGFLAKYPNGYFAKDAKLYISEIDYHLAVAENSITGYQNYLLTLPETKKCRIANDSLCKLIQRKMNQIIIPVKPDKDLLLEKIFASGETSENSKFKMISIYSASQATSKVTAIDAHFRQSKDESKGYNEVNIWLPGANLLNNSPEEIEKSKNKYKQETSFFSGMFEPDMPLFDYKRIPLYTSDGKPHLVMDGVEATIEIADDFKIHTTGAHFIDETLQIQKEPLSLGELFKEGALCYRQQNGETTDIIWYSFKSGALLNKGFAEQTGNRTTGSKSLNGSVTDTEKLKISAVKTEGARTDGSIHVIFGNVTLFGYQFNSVNENPLIFKMTRQGYQYLGGKGSILDKQNNQTWVF
jgi:outer membrane protein assembly factor BamD (BamD/ComL family)